ncbi:MAG: hypothetical protein QM785_09905 [Pyrinomonadaceae bacterium]
MFSNRPLSRASIALCLTAILSFVAFAQDNSVLVNQAKGLMDSSKYDEAIVILNGILTKDPGNADALTQRARAFVLQDKFSEAGADADKVLAKDPKNLFALNVRGMVKMAKKDLEGAIRDFSDVIATDATFFRSYFQRAEAKGRRGDPLQNILADYDLAILHSQNTPSYLQRAGDVCLTAGGPTATCAAYFLKLQKASPAYMAGYYGFGLVYSNAYQSIKDRSTYDREVIPSFKKAIELAPDNGYPPYGLCKLFYRLDRFDEALPYCDKSVSVAQKFVDGYSLRSLVYLMKKEYDKAIADQTKAIDLDPKFAYSYYLRGLTRERKGRNTKVGYKTAQEIAFWDQALDDYKKQAQLSNNDYDSYLHLETFAINLSKFAASQQGNSALNLDILKKKDDLFRELAGADLKNVCARYFVIQRLGYFEFKAQWDAVVKYYDGKNGGKCVAQAAKSIGREYSDPYGKQRPDLEKAKFYFEAAKKADPSLTTDMDYLIAKLPEIRWSAPSSPQPVTAKRSSSATSGNYTNFEDYRVAMADYIKKFVERLKQRPPKQELIDFRKKLEQYMGELNTEIDRPSTSDDKALSYSLDAINVQKYIDLMNTNIPTYTQTPPKRESEDKDWEDWDDGEND